MPRLLSECEALGGIDGSELPPESWSELQQSMVAAPV
jgi:hypothetical protein